MVRGKWTTEDRRLRFSSRSDVTDWNTCALRLWELFLLGFCCCNGARNLIDSLCACRKCFRAAFMTRCCDYWSGFVWRWVPSSFCPCWWRFSSGGITVAIRRPILPALILSTPLPLVSIVGLFFFSFFLLHLFNTLIPTCISVAIFSTLSLWVFLCVCVCLAVSLSLCLSVCLSVCLAVCLCVCLCICLCVFVSVLVCLFVRMSVYLSVLVYVCVCLCICLHVCHFCCMFADLCVYLCICLFVCLLVCLSLGFQFLCVSVCVCILLLLYWAELFTPTHLDCFSLLHQVHLNGCKLQDTISVVIIVISIIITLCKICGTNRLSNYLLQLPLPFVGFRHLVVNKSFVNVAHASSASSKCCFMS